MISQALVNAIKQKSGLDGFINANLIQGGYWNQVWKAEFDGGPIVIRVSHLSTPAAAVAYEHKFLNYFAKHIPQVPAPFQLIYGNTFFKHNNCFITLFPFMPGSPADRTNPHIRSASAAMLAYIHQFGLNSQLLDQNPNRTAIKDLDWQNNNSWKLQRIYTLLEKQPEALKNALSAVQNNSGNAVDEILRQKDYIHESQKKYELWIRSTANSQENLITGPTHGDFYRGNILAINNQITAVIDWEECKREWLVYELARATWEFCKNEMVNTLDFTFAEDFLRAYWNAGGPVKQDMIKLLPPLICCIRLEEIFFNLDEAVRKQSWDAAYTLHNLLSIRNLSTCSWG